MEEKEIDGKEKEEAKMCYFRSFYLSFVYSLFIEQIYTELRTVHSPVTAFRRTASWKGCARKHLGPHLRHCPVLALRKPRKKTRNISVRIVGVPSEIRVRYLDRTDLLGLHAAGMKLTSPQTDSSF